MIGAAEIRMNSWMELFLHFSGSDGGRLAEGIYFLLRMRDGPRPRLPREGTVNCSRLPYLLVIMPVPLEFQAPNDQSIQSDHRQGRDAGPRPDFGPAIALILYLKRACLL